MLQARERCNFKLFSMFRKSPLKRRLERRREERLAAGKMQETTGRQGKDTKTDEETRTEHGIAVIDSTEARDRNAGQLLKLDRGSVLMCIDVDSVRRDELFPF